MSYNETIHAERIYVESLGPNVTKDNFHGLYNTILGHWFSASNRYMIHYQSLTPGAMSKSIILRQVRRLHGIIGHDHILIINLKRPSQWTAAGRQMVMDELADYIGGGQFDHTQHNTIYGMGAIGLHWMVCKMQRSGDCQPSLVVDWQDDITSDTSYAEFGALADLVYNIA
jgi:hypothetical protein